MLQTRGQVSGKVTEGSSQERRQSKKRWLTARLKKYVSATACFTAHIIIIFPLVQFQNLHAANNQRFSSRSVHKDSFLIISFRDMCLPQELATQSHRPGRPAKSKSAQSDEPGVDLDCQDAL